MLLNCVIQPSSEPVSIENLEAQVRFDLTSESSIGEMNITAARECAENVTRRSLITQTWELRLQAFPYGRNPINLPKPPLQKVNSIKYIDVNGIEQTLDPIAYRVIKEMSPNCGMGYVVPAYGLNWPVALNDIATVTINYTCGYGPLADSNGDIPEGAPDNIPVAIKQWILINAANLFENRESVVIGSGRETVLDLTSTVANGLIENYRLPRL